MSSPIPPIDLTQRPPRSMRQRLGGFVLLPRILDKGRAKLAKKKISNRGLTPLISMTT
jgi:hypothetical protein